MKNKFGNRFLPDQPIENCDDDILGFGHFVNLIKFSIYHTQAPFVFGILGDWGSGKTSTLNMLKVLIEQDFKDRQACYIPIHFNAWKYETEANLIYPLLHAIKNDYEERTKEREKTEFHEQLRELVLATTMALADFTLRALTKKLIDEAVTLDDVKGHLDEAGKLKDPLNETLDKWASDIDNIHDSFEQLLKLYAERAAKLYHFNKEEIRFIILIDDLDRCLPETTINILESIKNYLEVPGCIFVLALNAKVVYQGIRIKYHNLDINGREYLEKILNYSFYVPESLSADLENFASSSLQKLIEDQLTHSELETYTKAFRTTLSECQFGNPRKIKRILNHYIFFLNRHDSDLDRFSLENITRFIILGEYYPELLKLFLYAENEQRIVEDFQVMIAGSHGAGKSGTRLEELEARYGIVLSPIIADLVRMEAIFKFKECKASLSEHAKAVYQITRQQ